MYPSSASVAPIDGRIPPFPFSLSLAVQLMQPRTVRKVCASVLALLIVTQASAHLDRLLSQDTLDYIGYYDNLILPVHLHARLVNSHVTRSAQRLNQYEVAGLEAEMGRRMRDSQHLLHEWTSWLTEIEQEQCHLLLTYKAAAQQVRTQMAAKISRNPALNKLHLPVHVIHNGQDVQPNSAFVQRTNSQHGRDGATSQATDAPVPRHCRMTRSEREAELADARRLDVPHCPLDAIVPRLFKEYVSLQ
ncbi:unnamed protein product [Dicrocoelium dendriticum]|nr:unnamed protein product [Dicrocoelium dendriticum]